MLHWAKLQSITQDTATRLEQALERWTAVLGADHTIVDGTRLAAAETATFSTTQSVPAILRTANTSQIQECLRIATRFRIPVYPISSGKNWGYGSSVPVSTSSVLLDLGRLNQIVDFSEELAYVTVEPGVTQGQLHEFLQARKSNLWLDATGAGPDCSLIGNVMERGFGHTPYGDHFAQVCGFEVVLPTGDVAQTDSHAFQISPPRFTSGRRSP
jgi:4-cresol dehydrogenase (hydroxylating)